MIIKAIPAFALTGQTLALQNLSSSGLIARTGAGTLAARTITGTADQVTVSNGDGVSGNPTLSLPQDIATTSTPEFAGLTITIDASFNYDSILTFNNENADPGGIGCGIWLQSEGTSYGVVGARPNSGDGVLEFGVKSGLATVYPLALTPSIMQLADGLNIGLGLSSCGTSATNTFGIKSGTPPSSSPADAFQMYSADLLLAMPVHTFAQKMGLLLN